MSKRCGKLFAVNNVSKSIQKQKLWVRFVGCVGRVSKLALRRQGDFSFVKKGVKGGGVIQ